MTKLLLCCLETELCIPETEDDIVSFLSWSAGFLHAGVWPELGFNGERFANASYRSRKAGQRLASEWSGAFSLWKGDLKAKVKTHRFRRRNWQSHFICERCCAHKLQDQLLFTDFSPSAPWRLTRLSHDGYLAAAAGLGSPWIGHPGWELTRCGWDWMHLLLLTQWPTGSEG